MLPFWPYRQEEPAGHRGPSQPPRAHWVQTLAPNLTHLEASDTRGPGGALWA